MSDKKWLIELRSIERVRVINEIKGLELGQIFEVKKTSGGFIMQRGGNRRNENFLRNHLVKRNLSVVITA